MESFFQDVRFSIRNLRRRPGFLVAALLTLTLGIGGTTTIFTVVNGALLRPLPYSDPDELVMVWERADAAGYPKVPLADADFVDYRERIRTLSQMAMFGYQGSTLTGLGDPAFIQSSQVSPALFPMLGVEAILGRTFTPDEEEPGHEAAAVLSHAFWQERFGGEESALGTTIELNGRPYTVVGVLPPSFLFPPPVSFLGQTLAGRIELFTPMVMDPEGLRRGNHSNMTIGRIAEGYSIGQVDAEVANIAAGLAAEYPDELSGVGAWVTPLRRQSVELVRTTIVLLLAEPPEAKPVKRIGRNEIFNESNPGRCDWRTMDGAGRLRGAIFQSVTARTAGFKTIHM